MSQESRVKSQEEFDKFPIPNSQFPILWGIPIFWEFQFFWGLGQRGCYSGFWKSTVTTLPSVTAKFGIFKKLEFKILKLD
jgi:hypothetical protein